MFSTPGEQGIHRVRRAAPLKFPSISVDARYISDRCLDHRQSMPTADRGGGLERRVSRRHEADLRQPQTFTTLDRSPQVANVNGVERTP